MSSNISFKLKSTPSGWITLVFPFATPWILPALVSVTRQRPVHATVAGFVFFWALALLGVLRRVRLATVLEDDGIRMHRTFATRFLPWSEIAAVEVREGKKVRIAQVRTTAGQLVRLPAPLAGGGSDGSQFDAQLAEIAAAWAAANPSAAGVGEPGRKAGPAKSGARKA